MVEEKPKAKAVDVKKPKPSAKAKVPETTRLVDWDQLGKELEAEIKKKGWTKELQQRNPRYLDGLVRRMILRPLVQSIYKNL